MNDNRNQPDTYDDIINLPHHISAFHRPMSAEGRAAQFAAFAALTGYEEVIAESARATAARYMPPQGLSASSSC